MLIKALCAAVVFGVQTWGHVISRDLAHWKTLPTALVPDTPYDESGCFSGSATIVNGTPTLLYTGTLIIGCIMGVCWLVSMAVYVTRDAMVSYSRAACTVYRLHRQIPV